MKTTLLVLLTLSFFADTGICQPGVAWMRMYDNNGEECFYDVYGAMNEDYVLCGESSGRFWLVRVDNEGAQLWSNTYNGNRARSIIEADNGNLVCGGYNGDNFHALMVNADGELIWENDYGLGRCKAVIELKDGRFVLAGRTEVNGNRQGYVVLINAEGQALWARNYGNIDDGWREALYAMRETEGGIIVAGDVHPNAATQFWVIKINFDGELLWDRNHGDGRNVGQAWDMTSTEDGFVFTGWHAFGLDHPYALKIDALGREVWWQCYENHRDHMNKGTGIVRMREGGFAIVGYGQAVRGDAPRGEKPFAVRTTSQGVFRWEVFYSFWENEGFGQYENEFHSVIVTDENEIVAAGTINVIDEEQVSQEGLLMKLQPDVLEPIIFYWSPEDTILSALPSDTLQFIVRARDQQGNDLNNLWIMGEDTLGRDTTTTVVFEDFGEFQLHCQISNDEGTSEITWHIAVVEWYIDMFQPDSTNIAIRRGSSIDFTHHIRAIDEREFTYRWDHFGRGGNFEIEGDDSINFIFNLTGEHLIRAAIMHNIEQKTVEWDVNVHSILWWWWPHEFELSVPQDTTMAFEVFPFNEESDSLEYTWFLYDEELDSNNSSIEIPFTEIGEYEITAYATEGIEADTIRWIVGVQERSFTADETGLSSLPTSPVFYTAAPNPFNSLTRIEFYLPGSMNLKAGVFDHNGRLVRQIDRGELLAGWHEIAFDAEGLASGLYLLQLCSGRVNNIQKVILLK